MGMGSTAFKFDKAEIAFGLAVFHCISMMEERKPECPEKAPDEKF